MRAALRSPNAAGPSVRATTTKVKKLTPDARIAPPVCAAELNATRAPRLRPPLSPRSSLIRSRRRDAGSAASEVAGRACAERGDGPSVTSQREIRDADDEADTQEEQGREGLRTRQ